MCAFNREEFIDLVKKLTEAQYDEPNREDPIKMEWMPAESQAKTNMKAKMFIANRIGSIDLTNVKSDKIKENIFKCTNLKVGQFTIVINHYGNKSNYGANTKINEGTDSLSLTLWEKRTRTPNGHPCNMDFSFAPEKDTRFTGCNWIKCFSGSSASCISIPAVIEMIRMMQIATKLPVFL